MEARIIDDMLHQNAIFKGVKTKISTKGEGGEALVRGEADMALQLICEVLNHSELELVGTVPEELHAYIDSKVAVSTRSTQADAAKGFIAYMLRPDHNALWKSKGWSVCLKALAMLTVRLATPATSPFSTSPGFTGPTPAGVPV